MIKTFITPLLLIFCFTLHAQEKVSVSNVPAAVIKTYQSQNSVANPNDIWRKYKDRYTVEWINDEREDFVFSYKNNGEWINRVKLEKESDVPNKVKDDAVKRYEGYKIEHINSEVSNDGKFYVVYLDNAKKEKKEAYYLMSGEFVK